jgi:hypothetical protein
VTSATQGVATVPPANAAEKRAAALAAEAMGKDFLNMAYGPAEKKLRQGIQLCAQKDCSVPFTARLHRDLGVLYIVGLNRVEPGKDEFMAALVADPTVAISQDMNTPEVEAAFLEIKRGLSGEPQPAAAPAATADTVELKADTDAEGGSATAWRDAANWVSIGIQQDFMAHLATKYVCNSNPNYACYDGVNAKQDFSDGTKYPQMTGNEIRSMTIRSATTRVLVGYERLLSNNFSAGLKLGMVIAGKPIRLPTDPAFLAFHGEARFSYYPGSSPFATNNPLRPYVFASVGFAEFDSKVSVDVQYPVGGVTQNARVVAWRRTGKVFAGAGVGAMYALGKRHGPFLEGRLIETFGKSATVMAVQAGYSVGF